MKDLEKKKRSTNIENNSKKRNSAIELLRIIAMIMIVAHHFAVHGKFQVENTTFINNIWLEFLSSGGKIGVNLFIMISGYFLIDSKSVNIKKVLKLLLQMLFYSLIILIIFGGFNGVTFSIGDLFNHVLAYPIWWFAKAYLVLYLIHPYINKFLNILQKKEYQRLIIFSTILWSVIPTLTTIPFDSGSLIWFIYIYSLGFYLKKYPIKFNLSPKKYIFISIILFILTFMLVIVFKIIGTRISLVSKYSGSLFNIDKITTLLISLFLFMGFSSLRIKYNKFINIVSSSTFGIYLLHECDYVRVYLWQTLFKNASYSDTLLLIPYSLMVIAIVFVGCSVIELLRIYVIEKRYMILLDKISTFINKYVNKFLDLKFFDKI